MPKTSTPQTAFEHSLFDVLRTAFRITRKDPRFALRALRLMRRQQKAGRVRAENERQGTHVPPFVIYSVTERCNLSCEGCYANLLHRTDRTELEDARVRGLFHEARTLGVSVMLLAGGEPMTRKDLLELTSTAPEILFLLFTNGSLLTAPRIQELRSQSHVIPVLSLEGDQDLTDARRGEGTHASVLGVMARLQSEHVFFGTSTTLTRENFDLATSEAHLRDLLRRGCKLFYFINYVPVQEGTENLQLTAAQVQELEQRLSRYRRSLPALFIAFPHDEVALGGCLAAGRGFVHINAVGDVEPCPFSPFSDSNLAEVSLKKALRSPLFAKILSSNVKLDERDGRCALWKRRDWVAGLLGETEQLTEAGTASVGSTIRPPGSEASPARAGKDLAAPVNQTEQLTEAGTASVGSAIRPPGSEASPARAGKDLAAPVNQTEQLTEAGTASVGSTIRPPGSEASPARAGKDLAAPANEAKQLSEAGTASVGNVMGSQRSGASLAKPGRNRERPQDEPLVNGERPGEDR